MIIRSVYIVSIRVNNTYKLKTDKVKLTLGIDRDTIKKAKKAGINISEITENLLNAVTYNTHPISYDEIVRSYEIFLMEIQKILKKYDLVISVGTREQVVNEKVNEGPLITEGIVLNGAGLYTVDDERIVRRIKVEEVLLDLDEPAKILEQLFKRLIKTTEISQRRVHELNFALKLLHSLSEDINKGKDEDHRNEPR